MNRTIRSIFRRRMSLAQARPVLKDVSCQNVRKTFLDYFGQKNHAFVRSSPVLPFNDPSLAFVNAGMNQFKSVFLGTATPVAKRVVNSQKCVRVGGKHNDLGIVGTDGTHHTFFEMLGNWSFGDYFKREACALSWELLTKVYGIQPERLYVTYFAGEKSLGLGPDLETLDVWKSIGVPESHILPFGMKDNFWEMGSTGPCGPCTEIHYDCVPGRRNASAIVNTDSKDLVELWNVVFIQYNRMQDQTLKPLRTHHVDTGMGFERLVSVLQGTNSNYDTDVFATLFEGIEKFTGHSGYTSRYEEGGTDTAYRVLADHARMATVCLADGCLPYRESKLRFVIRRAFAVSEEVFGVEKGLLKELTNYVAESLGETYPEIWKNLHQVQHIIDHEEEVLKALRIDTKQQWSKILKSHPAMAELEVEKCERLAQIVESYRIAKIHPKGSKTLSNEVAWTMIDAHSLSVEHIEHIACVLKLDFDPASFKQYSDEYRAHLKEGVQSREKEQIETSKTADLLRQNDIEPTADSFKYRYDVTKSGEFVFKKQPATVVAIIVNDQLMNEVSLTELSEESKIGLVLDRTSMYSTAGGQVSDTGSLLIEKETIFDIYKVVKLDDFVIHYGTFRKPFKPSKVSVHNIGVIEIDGDRRSCLMRNHTATHLLHAVLKKSLIVTAQVRSKVEPEDLSFDFALYGEVFGVDEIEKVEQNVLNVIRHDVPVLRRTVKNEDLLNLDGTYFLPGESYIQPEINVIDVNSGYFLSREPCCGTHVLNTSEIKDFVITDFRGKASGVKNIKAVTGEAAAEARAHESLFTDRFLHLIPNVEKLLARHDAGSETDEEIERLEEDIKSLLKPINALRNEMKNCKAMPFVVKTRFEEQLVENIDELKYINQRDLLSPLKAEIKEAMEKNKNKYFVYFVADIPKVEKLLLRKFTSFCPDKPVMMFFKYGNRIRGRCCVPKNMVTNQMTAKKWMESVLKSAAAEGHGSRAGNSNSKLAYHMKDVPWTEAEVDASLEFARQFAEKHC